MTSCCDANGVCNQGRDCPARAATPPAPKAQRACDELGVCNSAGDCPKCPSVITLPAGAPFAPGEAGNFWLAANTEPDEALTLREVLLAFLWLLLCTGALAALVGFAGGLTWGLWP